MSATLPKRANLGCGNDYRDGWLNVDNAEFHRCDVSADVRKLAELPAAHFTEVVAKDVLEHIGRTEQVDTLKGWARLLAPGGTLFVSVPSFFDLAHLARFSPLHRDAEKQHALIQCGWGTQAYPGDFHFCSYTPVTLLDLAESAGLQLIDMTLRDGWLYYAIFNTAGSSLSDEQWLQQAYFRYLWRPADAEGLQYHLGLLKSGKMTRTAVAKAFASAKVLADSKAPSYA